MKRNLVVFTILVISIFLTACSNEEIKQAIDDCKNDTDCKQIIDNAIDEELEARNISGGKITLEELEKITALYNDIYFGDQYVDEYYGLLGTANINNQDLYNYFELQPKLKNIKLNELFEQEKQFLLIDDQKHMIYASGNSSYKYEIISYNGKEEFIIDLTFNSISNSNKGTKYNKEDLFTDINSGKFNTDNNFIKIDDNSFFGISIENNFCKSVYILNGKTLNLNISQNIDNDINEIVHSINATLMLPNYNGNEIRFSYSGFDGDIKDLIEWVKTENISETSGNENTTEEILNMLDQVFTNHGNFFLNNK